MHLHPDISVWCLRNTICLPPTLVSAVSHVWSVPRWLYNCCRLSKVTTDANGAALGVGIVIKSSTTSYFKDNQVNQLMFAHGHIQATTAT